MPHMMITFDSEKLSGSSPPVVPATILNAFEAVELQKVRSPIDAPSRLKNLSPQCMPLRSP